MRKTKLPTKERRLQAWAMFMGGLEYDAIAAKLGVTKSTVAKDIRIGLIGELQDFRNSFIMQSNHMNSLIKQLRGRMKNKADF